MRDRQIALGLGFVLLVGVIAVLLSMSGSEQAASGKASARTPAAVDEGSATATETPAAGPVRAMGEAWWKTPGDFELGAVVDRPDAPRGQRISKASFEAVIMRLGHENATRIDGVEGEPDCNVGAVLMERYGFEHDPERLMCAVTIKGEFVIMSPHGTSATIERMINLYDGDTGAYLGTVSVGLD